MSEWHQKDELERLKKLKEKNSNKKEADAFTRGLMQT
jgi:hypothetical protein